MIYESDVTSYDLRKNLKNKITWLASIDNPRLHNYSYLYDRANVAW